MFGKTDADVMGKKMSDIGILGDEKQDPDTRFQILPADYIYRKEMTFLNQEKTPFIAEIALSHIRIKGQDSILLQIHDINEIRKAHDAVRKANDKLNILSSITRHDILNRVMIASLNSEEIKESVTDPTIIRYLNAISQASADIEHLIGFTKEYQDLGTTTPAWQRVDTLLHEPTIIGLVPGIQIKSELGLLEIYADLMLEKVLYNLVDNSVRHGQNLSVIRCSFEIQDNDCILMYEDNGGGVPDSEKEKIFERGFGKNTGMGLFLISEILSITGIGITEKGKFGEGVSFQMRVPSGKWHI